MREKLTEASEDYLKVIYNLETEYGRATTNQIAERMGVTPASVTGMLQKMAASEPPLVEYQKHRGVVLTPQGESVALEIIRHHRLLELFLQEALGYSWDEVHSEADRLEHVISEEFEERMAQILGDPSHDPHGEPIPTRDFRLPTQSAVRLSDLRPGQQAVIERIDSPNPKLLRYLGEIGVRPGVQVDILDYSAFDENLTLLVEGQNDPIVLGRRVTEQIFVKSVVE